MSRVRRYKNAPSPLGGGGILTACYGRLYMSLKKRELFWARLCLRLCIFKERLVSKRACLCIFKELFVHF